MTEVPTPVSQQQFVTAFYTTRLFKLERLILKWVVTKPSTDDQAEQLAAGTIDEFAAWYVEKRAENQLLLSDFHGRTRSWLMVTPLGIDGNGGTRLYFGSAVVAVANSTAAGPTFGFIFRVLLGFHKIYSRFLLLAARLRLNAQLHA